MGIEIETLLIDVGICAAILLFFDLPPRGHQVCDDGDGCFEFVWIDEWFAAAVPQVQHCHDIFRVEEREIMGSEKARHQNVWAQ